MSRENCGLVRGKVCNIEILESRQMLAANLVASYSFSEGVGTLVADVSGHGHPGTISNATWTTSGKYGDSLEFNGTNALVTIPDTADLHLTVGMTLEAWVNPTAVDSSWRDVIYKGNDNYYLSATSTSNSRPTGAFITGTSYVETFGKAALPTNTWTHLAVTYNGAHERLYVNGVQVSSVAHAGNIATSINPLQIGGDSIFGQYFKGKIDEVRIYNGALTGAQIQQDMATPIGNGGGGGNDTQPPTAPGNLTATDGGIINLSWTSATDNMGVTNYLIERQEPGALEFTLLNSTTGTTYTDSAVMDGATYSYRVRAIDAAGNLGPYSSTTTSIVGSFVPIPGLATWESQMLEFGAQHAAWLQANQNGPIDPALAATYYDAAEVFSQIAIYTGDSSWNAAAQAAVHVYRDRFAVPDNGAVPGYWLFTRGLVDDYLRTGATASRDAVLLLAQNAAYGSDSTPLAWTADISRSREVAYNLEAELNAETLGAPHRARTDQLANQALGHLAQWTVSLTAEYTRPFMVGLTCEALIQYQAKTGDPRVLPAIRTALDWLWSHMWVPSAMAFQYTNIDTATLPTSDEAYNTGGTDPAPDLNMLIAHAYAWVYHETGLAQYRDEGDQVFLGGVQGAFLAGPKQFNQNYRNSFDYVAWRSAIPLT